MLNRAISIDPNVIDSKIKKLMTNVYVLTDPKTISALLKDLQAHRKSYDPFQYKYIKGTLLQENKHYKEAITCYKAALSLFELSKYRWLKRVIRVNLAELYLETKNRKEAQKYLVELDSTAQFNIYYKHKEFNSCLPIAQDMLKEDEDSNKIDWQFHIADIYFNLKEYKQAEIAIKVVIEYQQFSTITRYKIFFLYGQILYKQERYKDSLRELESAIYYIQKDKGHTDKEDELSIRLVMAEIQLTL